MTGSSQIPKPYLLFVGDEARKPYLKTAYGLVDWRRSDCVGQLRLTPGAADLGLPDLDPKQAVEAGAKTLVIGTALVGGTFPSEWLAILKEALDCGLNIAAGQHRRLKDEPLLVAAANAAGCELFDVRVPPSDLPVGKGVKRTGMRLLTVGTDCAVGKKYTALALALEMRSRAIDVDFRASGQTGILIAGGGIPIDAVVCDFTSGAAETLSPAADPSHWDVIEGQGSLFHPGYAGVSLGLLHGSQPDAIVMCHDPSREEMVGFPGFSPPSVQDCIARNLEAARLTNLKVKCVGISVNSSAYSNEAAASYLAQLAQSTNLPCVDPIRMGVGPLVDRLQSEFGC